MIISIKYFNALVGCMVLFLFCNHHNQFGLKMEDNKRNEPIERERVRERRRQAQITPRAGPGTLFACFFFFFPILLLLLLLLGLSIGLNQNGLDWQKQKEIYSPSQVLTEKKKNGLKKKSIKVLVTFCPTQPHCYIISFFFFFLTTYPST